MEKRTSAAELRLGFSLNWQLSYLTSNKYYLDNTKTILLFLNFLNGLEKELDLTIPKTFFKIFISQKYIYINYVYLNNRKNKEYNELLFTLDDMNIEEDTPILDKSHNYVNQLYNLTSKLKNNSRKKNKLKQFFIKKLKNKKTNLKKLTIINLNTLNLKLYQLILNELFNVLTKKLSKITNINLHQILNKNSEKLFKNFYDIKQWYKKIGGNLFKFKQTLMLSYFSLTYKDCLPLLINMTKQNIEENITKQKIMMTNMYNILFAYTWVQRNIEGLRINFKGTIGNHGRAKSLTFMLGLIYQSSLIRPIEYYSIKIDTKYGSIGMRIWCIFNN